MTVFRRIRPNAMPLGWRRFTALAVIVAVFSPIASHAALAMGRGYGAALALAGAQAVASGVLLAGALPGRRWLGLVLGSALLGGLALGARSSAEAGLLVAAGAGHAILYAALLGVFAASMRPGRISLVTTVASRVNPHFHSGMKPYTRGVTVAWCVFFAAQLVASALLLAADPGLWRAFVTTLHAPLVAVMAVGEYLVRRWRWRHEHYTSLGDTIRGVARLRREAAAARTSKPAADCP